MSYFISNILRIMLAASFVFGAYGCSALAEKPAMTELVITYATLKVIGSEGDLEARAEKVRDIADRGILLLDLEQVSLELLEDEVRHRISEMGLDQADTLLADALVATVMEELRSKVDSGAMSPEAKMTASHLLRVVKAAAGG